MISIATLLTCHNRKEKTLSCISHFFVALEKYNDSLPAENKVKSVVFLTDDGCTDGTVQSVLAQFPEKEINIIKGNGNLFWAGGMRVAWNEALKQNDKWNYYLLLNDDTDMFDNAFESLFSAQRYCLENCRKEGIISGITSDKNDQKKTTYGGDVWVNHFLGTSRRLNSTGEPQKCDMANANILLVPKYVVDRIGIFYQGFQHGEADYDYTIQAGKKGIPLYLTAFSCGHCEYDHIDKDYLAKKVINMSFSERRSFFNYPLHSSSDYLRYIRRNSPIRLPLVWIGRKMNLFFPRWYYKISNSVR